MNNSMCFSIITFGQPQNKISFMQVQTNQQTRQLQIKNVSRPHNFSLLEGQIDLLIQAPIHQDITQSFCDILEEVEAGIPFQNIYNGVRHTKVAILVIDGSIVLGDDLAAVSDEFKRRDIVLIVVAEVTPHYDIWNCYYELARNTGGEYMLLEDVSSMWSNVIASLILGENIRLQMDLEYMSTNTSVTDDTDDQNEITNDVEDLPFDHGLY